MNRLAICRICLNANVSHRVLDTQLKDMYEKLTSMSFQNAMKPSLVCHICHAQLHKACRLMMKCLKAEEILTQMLNQLVASKEQVKQDPIQIDRTEFAQFICTAVQHVDIEPLPNINERICFTFKEDLIDVKTEVDSEEDIRDPVDDIQQAFDHSDVDNVLTCCNSEDGIPLNNLKKEIETVTDKQNITRVEKNQPIGWEKGALVASESKQEPQTNNTKVNKFKDNADSVPSIIAPNHEVTMPVRSVKTKSSTILEGTTDKEIYNKHDSVAESENKYDQWNDSLEIQHNGEYIPQYIVETLIANENNVSDEDTNNKKIINLIISNKTLINAASIKNCVQNVTSSYPCDQKSDTDDFKQYKISQNNNRHCKSSTKVSGLVRHSVNKTQFICDICKRDYSCKSKLKTHVRTHTGERPYSCKICDKGFTQKGNIKRHERIHNGERPYSCKICDKKFTQKSDIKIHERIHTGERPYSCEICNHTFTQISHLKIHEHIHTGERPNSCKICDKRFTQKSDIKKHEHIHTVERPYGCKICDKRFTQKADLKIHERIHTGERLYSCKICDKRFKLKSDIKRHERIHTGERPYSCKICDKRFIQKSDIKRHERIHTDEKPYSCKICDKRFTKKSNIKRHELIHTGEGPYCCKICDKRFTQKGDIKIHERIHTGERPYSCKICDKRFIQKSDLKRHERIHTGEKPYTCKICYKRFTQKSVMKRHERIHTSDRP